MGKTSKQEEADPESEHSVSFKKENDGKNKPLATVSSSKIHQERRTTLRQNLEEVVKDIDTRVTYSDEHIQQILRVILKLLYGDYQKDCQYLLAKPFAVEEGSEEKAFILITPATNTYEEDIPIVYFLDKTYQPNNIIVELLEYLLKEKCLEDLEKFYRTDSFITVELKRIFEDKEIDPSILKIVGNKLLENNFEFVSIQQLVSKLKERAISRDVFDEIMPELQDKTNGRVRILFPFNKAKIYHWNLGEILLKKTKETYEVELRCHDPYGFGNLSATNVKTVQDSVLKRIRYFDNSRIINFNYSLSVYPKRQLDDDIVSCGPIMVHDLLERIQGKALIQTEDHKDYAKNIRAQHLKWVLRHEPDDQASINFTNAMLNRRGKWFTHTNEWIISHKYLPLTQISLRTFSPLTPILLHKEIKNYSEKEEYKKYISLAFQAIKNSDINLLTVILYHGQYKIQSRMEEIEWEQSDNFFKKEFHEFKKNFFEKQLTQVTNFLDGSSSCSSRSELKDNLNKTATDITRDFLSEFFNLIKGKERPSKILVGGLCYQLPEQENYLREPIEKLCNQFLEKNLLAHEYINLPETKQRFSSLVEKHKKKIEKILKSKTELEKEFIENQKKIDKITKEKTTAFQALTNEYNSINKEELLNVNLYPNVRNANGSLLLYQAFVHALAQPDPTQALKIVNLLFSRKANPFVTLPPQHIKDKKNKEKSVFQYMIDLMEEKKSSSPFAKSNETIIQCIECLLKGLGSFDLLELCSHYEDEFDDSKELKKMFPAFKSFKSDIDRYAQEHLLDDIKKSKIMKFTKWILRQYLLTKRISEYSKSYDYLVFSSESLAFYQIQDDLKGLIKDGRKGLANGSTLMKIIEKFLNQFEKKSFDRRIADKERNNIFFLQGKKENTREEKARIDDRHCLEKWESKLTKQNGEMRQDLKKYQIEDLKAQMEIQKLNIGVQDKGIENARLETQINSLQEENKIQRQELNSLKTKIEKLSQKFENFEKETAPNPSANPNTFFVDNKQPFSEIETAPPFQPTSHRRSSAKNEAQEQSASTIGTPMTLS